MRDSTAGIPVATAGAGLRAPTKSIALPGARAAVSRLRRSLAVPGTAPAIAGRGGTALRLMLHIGTEKTGSTSLQTWLDANAQMLRERGIWYAEAPGRPANRQIAVCPRDPGHPDDGFWELGLHTAEDHARFRAELARRLAEEVADARDEGCTTFVISSEHLHSRLTTPEEVARLRDMLVPLFDGVSVVCFLRPQIDLAVSRLSMAAREGALVPDLLDRYVLHNWPYFDYLGMWERWTARFDDVTFLPFDQDRDVVGRVCTMLGIDKGAFAAQPRSMEKVDYRAAMLAHTLDLPKWSGGRINWNHQIFIDDLPVEEPIRPSRSQVRRFQASFAESNAALARACPTLEVADLTVDEERVPEEGTYDRIFAGYEAAPFARQAIVRLNAELWLERARTCIARAERAEARGNLGRARAFLDEAREMLDRARQAGLAPLEARLAETADEVAHIRARVADG